MKYAFTFLVGLVLSAYVAGAQTGVWSGKLDIQGAKLSLVFHLDGDNPTVDSPDQGVKGIPIQIERKASSRIFIKVPSLGASYDGVYLAQRIVGTFKQGAVSLPLTLTPGENKPRRPQTPQGPFPYSTEEVTFVNGDVTLNGTLVLPEGCSYSTPVLLMVTGSGQQNRDEELFDHRPFAVIADALARAGIATLRYDDRGLCGFTGNIYECTTEDFKEDAKAGVDYLRKRFDNVGVLGHSEGGTIAMMLAAEQEVDFIVSLAGMVVSGSETLVAQNSVALAEAGYDNETTATYCKALGEAFDALVNGDGMPQIDDYDLPEALKQNYIAAISQMQIPYMKHLLALDMRPILSKITCPVLALNGTKDVQVRYKENLTALRNGLSFNENNLVEAVEGVNHIFQHCDTGSVSEYRDIEETISPEVLEIIIQWIL